MDLPDHLFCYGELLRRPYRNWFSSNSFHALGLEREVGGVDPVTMVVAAVAAGAAAGLSDTTKKAVSDAYQGVRNLIIGRYRSADVAVLEHDPTSMARRAVLADELQQAGAGSDEELLAAAGHLLLVVHQHAPHIEHIVGVRLEEVRADKLAITDIGSTGSGVIAKDVEVSGTMTIHGVQAGEGHRTPHPRTARP